MEAVNQPRRIMKMTLAGIVQCLSSNLNDRAVRQVYLITYSKADPEKFPTRESFAQAVVKSVEATNTKTELWVCSKEAHQVNGFHYHMALKLNRTKTKPVFVFKKVS